jgi:ABC-2 type transport system permease protein
MSLLALSLRSVVRGRRVVFVTLLPLLVGLIAVALATRAGAAGRAEGYGTLTGDLLVPLVVALVALVLGVNAFGDERDERTLGLLVATTLPRWRIVVTKYAAAAAVTWLACLPGTLGCLVLAARVDELALGTAAWSLLLATLLAAAAYCAVFVLLSLVMRRAVLVGLAYLVLWEGLLAGNTVAFRNLSVGAYANRVAGAPYDDVPFAAADPSVAASALVLVAVTAVAVAAAAWRLPRAHL